MLRIEAPTSQPEKGGLLNALGFDTMPEGSNFAFSYGATIVSLLPGTPQLVPTDDTEKTFGEVSLDEYEGFDVYAGIRGKLVNDRAAAEESLKTAFEGGISHAVEEGVQRTLLNVDTQVLTEEAVTNPEVALGALEQWASVNFGARAMIHTNRLGAALLTELAGGPDRLETKQGSIVANGSGYGTTGPGGREATFGQAWMYVTRIPKVYRTQTMITKDSYLLKRNEFDILAEARILPIIEGPVGAVLLEG